MSRGVLGVLALALLGGAVLLAFMHRSGTRDASAQTQDADLVLVGTVQKIVDGDTADVLLDSGRVRVRFASIDAPEHAQPYGDEAAALLQRLIGGREVELSVETQDRYERLVAKVFVGGVDVNAELVRQGAAWAYRDYLTDKSFPALEETARCERRGLWAASAVPPWDWRRGERNGTDYGRCGDPAPQRKAPTQTGPQIKTLPPTFPAKVQGLECGTKHYCREMTSCEEAKFFLSQCGVTTLDGDRDGEPCEALCR